MIDYMFFKLQLFLPKKYCWKYWWKYGILLEFVYWYCYCQYFFSWSICIGMDYTFEKYC